MFLPATAMLLLATDGPSSLKPQASSLSLEARSSLQTLVMPFPGERMGLYGLELTRSFEAWAWGLGGYGSVTGKRGGFIALGLSGAWRPRLTDRINLDFGAFSGGGGAGRAAVGGGWMLEGHAGLDLRTAHGKFGLAWQGVHFPNGRIDSRQWRFSWSRPFRVEVLREPAHHPALPYREISLETTVLHYTTRTAHLLESHRSQGQMALAGVLAKAELGHGLFASLELDAAHSGGADGYMEGLVGLGLRRPLGDTFRGHLRLAGGPAGGGQVDVGGGMAWKALLGLEAKLGQAYLLGAEAGWITTPGGTFKAFISQASLGRRLRRAYPEGEPPQPGWRLHSLPLRMRAGISQLTRPREIPDGPVRSQTLALDLGLGSHLYLTGQGAFGTSGRAGGWATGLLGAGLEGRPFEGGPRVFFEGLAGAGGGGGIETRGGLLVQAVAGMAQPLGRQAELQLRAGKTKALRGGLDSPLFELAVGWRFPLAHSAP